MELFPAQPDLSLQISPPSSKHSPAATAPWRPRSTAEDQDEDGINLSPWKKALRSSANQNISSSLPTMGPTLDNFHLSQLHFDQAQIMSQRLNLSRPIRGIPIYHSHAQPNLQYAHGPGLEGPYLAAAAQIHGGYGSQQGLMRSRLLSRFPGKRSMRAPRMRWTTTLHSRFVHAVELLGGHERATPKSVLELMDVKDLTLAHVKSHLQMYRTVKSTDRAAATSGQSDMLENGFSGEISDDFLYYIQNLRKSDQVTGQQGGQINMNNDKEYHGPWINSSRRENPVHGRTVDYGEANIKSFKKYPEPKCARNYERTSRATSPSLNVSRTSRKEMPNLDFTLGRPL